jgi:hypothetical protein
MVHARREGRTLGEMIAGDPNYEMVDQSNSSITRGSHRVVELRHLCGDGKTFEFPMGANTFAKGHGCTPCGRKNSNATLKAHQKIGTAASAKKTSTPENENDSIFSLKAEYADDGIILKDSDDVLKAIKKSSRRRTVACECADCGRLWNPTPNALSAGNGCQSCGRKRSVAAMNDARKKRKIDET